MRPTSWSLLLSSLLAPVGCVTLAGIEEGIPRDAPLSAGGAAGSGGSPASSGASGQSGTSGQSEGGAGVAAGGTAGAAGEGGNGAAGGGAAGGGGQTAGGEGGTTSGASGQSGTGQGGGGSGGSAGAGGSDPVGVPVTEAHQLQWYRQYGSPLDESTEALAEDGEGGVYVAGKLHAPLQVGTEKLTPGPEDTLYLARLGKVGQVLWAHTITGKGMAVRGLERKGSSIFLFGTGGGTVAFPDATPPDGGTLPSASGTKGGLVVRFNEDGQPHWVQLFSGAAPSSCTFEAAVSANSSLLLAGTFTGTILFGDQGTLSSTGSPGQYKTDIAFLSLDYTTGGVLKVERLAGIGSESNPQMKQMGTSLVVTGTCETSVMAPGLGAQTCDGLFLGRMDNAFKMESFRSYPFEQASGLRLSVRPGAAIFLGGRYQGKATLKAPLPDSHRDFQGFLARLSQDGTPEKSITLSKIARTEIAAMEMDADGGLLVGGWTRGGMLSPGGALDSQPPGEQNAYLMKLDDLLEPQFTWLYPGSGAGLVQGVSGVAHTKDGSLFVGASMKGGFTVSNEAHESAGERDIVLLKYAP